MSAPAAAWCRWHKVYEHRPPDGPYRACRWCGHSVATQGDWWTEVVTMIGTARFYAERQGEPDRVPFLPHPDTVPFCTYCGRDFE